MSLFAGCGLIGALFALATTVFWIWMIIDCATNESLQGTDKIVWLIVIIFLHFLGAVVYYFVAKRRTL